MQLTPEEMVEWRNHPVTLKVRQYLKDYRQDLMEQWAVGDMPEDRNPFYRGVVTTLKQTEDINYENLSTFYDLEQENEEDNEQSETEDR